MIPFHNDQVFSKDFSSPAKENRAAHLYISSTKASITVLGEGNCFTMLCYFLLYNNIYDSPCLQDWDHILSLIHLPSNHISENLPCSVCVWSGGWGEGIPHATKQLSDTGWVSKIQLNSDSASLEIASDSTGEGLSPTDHTPTTQTSNAHLKSKFVTCASDTLAINQKYLWPWLTC